MVKRCSFCNRDLVDWQGEVTTCEHPPKHYCNMACMKRDIQKKKNKRNSILFGQKRKDAVDEGMRLGAIQELKTLQKELERIGKKDTKGMDYWWAFQRIIDKRLKELSGRSRGKVL